MYNYTIQAMPGSKAKFEGDTSVKYRVSRKHTSASANQKSVTAVIRTDLDFTEAAALVKRFNDKERESRSIRNEEGSRPTSNV
jgi:2',3'-cyclic-nucleotide 2'-phosphodiesterase (5'-nucleotidase family)